MSKTKRRPRWSAKPAEEHLLERMPESVREVHRAARTESRRTQRAQWRRDQDDFGGGK